VIIQLLFFIKIKNVDNLFLTQEFVFFQFLECSWLVNKENEKLESSDFQNYSFGVSRNCNFYSLIEKIEKTY